MAVKDSVKTYCLYCKKILSDSKEIKLQYHISCKNELEDFEKEDKGKIGFLSKALSLPKSQIVKLLGDGDIKYTLDKNNNITKLNINSDIYVNGKGLVTDLFNQTHLPTTELQELQVLSICFGYDWNHVDGWWKSDFKDLQENIGELKKLEILRLSGNSITALPESIGDLINLRELYLDGNDLKNLPKSISKLVNLEKLNLTDNSLSLPSEMSSLRNLKSLRIDEDQINSFVKISNNLTNLEELIIHPEFTQRIFWEHKEKSFKNLPDSVQICFKELKSKGCCIKLYTN